MKILKTVLCLYFAMSTQLWSQSINMDLLEGMKMRSIGPAGMSGRVTAIDVQHANPNVIYVGTASGGLWRSEGGGTAWKPIFANEKVASVGALALDQSNPAVIWVGTGEGNPRNSATSGAGVYKSIDYGVTWKCMGLEKTRNIHRVIIDPSNSDIVYVGAQGSAWGESEHRGIYKTIDGGKSWSKILYTNKRTGIGEMIMDPVNPNKIIASMWEFARWPWFFKSGGEGSGLHITHDGGETWKKLSDKDGLPKGELGRIGLAIAKSNPNIIYALIESKKNALYKSIDGGVKWAKVQDNKIGGRPFYYAEIAVDPENENRVYNIFSKVDRSEDGGKTFSTMLGWSPTRVHGDYHAIWIHPNDPSYMMLGNDGGLAISRDKGASWRFVENLPVGQFYHIETDHEVPYNIYGGMQDNGSWRGPSNSLRNGGLRNSYWDEIAFGDGFDVVPDPNNSRYAYGMWQGGNLLYIDLETGDQQYIKPVDPVGEKLRFNWNAAIASSSFDANTVYYGSQYVHKSTDKGQNWEIISPDLTTNDPEKQKSGESGGLTLDASGAENYTTILAISPSTLDEKVIWVTTDDGNLQLTRNGGETWANLSSKIKDLKKGVWMPQIKASTYHAGEAFLVANDYRREDWTAWLYQTKDYGKTWTRLVDDTDVEGYVLSFVQDPVERNLMFVGTEFGLYISVDGGDQWNRWKGNYPTVSTYDMVIQEEAQDLVIGTYGRSIWILDDINALRKMASTKNACLDRTVAIYPAANSYLYARKEASGTRFQGDAIFKGDDKFDGAMITYSLAKTSKQDSTIKSDTVWVNIFDGNQKEIRKMFHVGKQGMNRFVWDHCQRGFRSTSTAKPVKELQDVSGRWVLPGEYVVQLKFGEDSVRTTLVVNKDPRIDVSEELMAKNAATYDEVNNCIRLSTLAIDQLNEVDKTIDRIVGLMKVQNKTDSSFSIQSKALKKSIKIMKELINEKEGIQGFSDDGTIISNRLWVAGFYNQLYSKNNESQQRVVSQLKAQLTGVLAQVNEFMSNDWLSYQVQFNALNIGQFKSYERLALDK